ncbi:related to retrotransposon protein [Ustilago sp. UG-2017b]|nr:related to retrotransposon protein [Ustilago sp. UG-2017b]
MPPSTRAGQTGREERDDDQAATTAGNGREEGWLTQVVRILQLVNPALTAEEAIVQAMSLVNIGNQAPRGEAEKIPKDVTSSIAHIKKLNEGNWHIWEPTFIDCLQRVHNAKEILYGEIAPGSEGYDEDLDKALVGLIHACCDNSPDSRIDTYTVRGSDEEAQLGSTLYAKLKKALTLNDAVKRVGLQDRIHTVRMYNRDVVRLGRELDSIWNDAARLGKRFDEDLKKSTLYRCTAQDWFYANSVDALKTAKPDCKYDEAYHALAKKQQDGEILGRIRGAARIVTSLIENGAQVTFDEFGTTIRQNDGTQVQFSRNRRQGRFEVRGQALALELEETLNDIPEDGKNTGRQNDVPEDDKNTGRRSDVPEDNRNTGDRDSYLWHERFGHPGRDKTRQIQAHYLGTDCQRSRA